MSYSGGYKDEDDLHDDEEEEEGGEMKTVNDHCILLIDARPNMFEPLNDDGDVREESPMQWKPRLSYEFSGGYVIARLWCIRC